MAGDPHNKEGKQCSRCDRIFTKTMATFTVPKRIQAVSTLREHELVCSLCAHEHYQ